MFAVRKRAVIPCATRGYGIIALSELGEIKQSCNKTVATVFLMEIGRMQAFLNAIIMGLSVICIRCKNLANSQCGKNQ